MQVWPRDVGLRVIDPDTVAAMRRHWEDGWNTADVDLICEPFAPDVVFSSPFVPRIVGDPEVWEIRGLDAVRQYVADSFERATQGIRYRCDHAHAGTDFVILAYTVLHPPASASEPTSCASTTSRQGRRVALPLPLRELRSGTRPASDPR
jgi:ketosteroid isomerase-like protein